MLMCLPNMESNKHCYKLITCFLSTFVNLRRILNFHWPHRITNQKLLRITNQSLVNETIKKKKSGWIGHSLRRKNSPKHPKNAKENIN